MRCNGILGGGQSGMILLKAKHMANYMLSVGPFCIVRNCTYYCAKHNQQVWEHAPQEILKNRCAKIESEGISESKYCIALLQD